MVKEIAIISVGKEPGQDDLHLIIEFKRGRKRHVYILERVKALQLINDLSRMFETA